MGPVSPAGGPRGGALPARRWTSWGRASSTPPLRAEGAHRAAWTRKGRGCSAGAARRGRGRLRKGRGRGSASRTVSLPPQEDLIGTRFQHAPCARCAHASDVCWLHVGWRTERDVQRRTPAIQAAFCLPKLSAEALSGKNHQIVTARWLSRLILGFTGKGPKRGQVADLRLCISNITRLPNFCYNLVVFSKMTSRHVAAPRHSARR